MTACPKQVKIKDEQHLARVREYPCLNCRTTLTIEPHHLLKPPGLKQRGMARKSGDNWTIPLCRRCHQALHWVGDEIKFFGEQRREEAVKFAAYLWNMTEAER